MIKYYIVKEKGKQGTLYTCNTIQQAKDFIQKELRERNEKDDYNEYWHNAPVEIVEKTEKTIETL